MYFFAVLNHIPLRLIVAGILTGFAVCADGWAATETEPSSERKLASPSSVRIAAASSGVPTLPTEAKTFEPLESECYPKALAEKVAPLVSGSSRLSLWAKSVTDCLGETVRSIEQEESQTFTLCLQQLKRSSTELTAQLLVRRAASQNAAQTTQESEQPSVSVLEDIQLALERRILLWETGIQAKLSSALPLSQHFPKDLADVQRLKERTQEVETFFYKHAANKKEPNFGSLWCEYLDTQSFLTELEACEKSIASPTRQVSAKVSVIPLPVLTEFCDHSNVILARLEESRLNEALKECFNAPPIIAWKEELRLWTADTVSVASFLSAVERYEANGGMSDMAALSRLADRLSFSYTAAYRQLGKTALEMYGDSNVKIYISEVLLNHLLPVKETEVARFRETIQGQPVIGQRQTDSEVAIELIPDEQRLLMMLNISGNIKTASRANAFATTLFNRGQAQYVARKKIELTNKGFRLSPSEVKIPQNRMELLNVKTNFDRIPLLSGMVRNIVVNQYEERQGEAKMETQQKMLYQVRTRIDKETEEPFQKFNEKFLQLSQTAQERFGITFEAKDAVTLDEWLLTSWAVRGQDSLGSHTPCPETLPGSFADLKIHESVLNQVVGKLELEGKKATVGEFRRDIAQKFERTDLTAPGDNDDVELAFAEENPVIIRFEEGHIGITINVKSLRLAGQTHRNFAVCVRYNPAEQEDGSFALERDGYIGLINAQRRSQIPLRAAFSVIFPPSKKFPLTVKLVETDPRFAALTTGHCRIHNGWFAIALKEKPASD